LVGVTVGGMLVTVAVGGTLVAVAVGGMLVAVTVGGTLVGVTVGSTVVGVAAGVTVGGMSAICTLSISHKAFVVPLQTKRSQIVWPLKAIRSSVSVVQPDDGVTVDNACHSFPSALISTCAVTGATNTDINSSLG